MNCYNPASSANITETGHWILIETRKKRAAWNLQDAQNKLWNHQQNSLDLIWIGQSSAQDNWNICWNILPIRAIIILSYKKSIAGLSIPILKDNPRAKTSCGFVVSCCLPLHINSHELVWPYFTHWQSINHHHHQQQQCLTILNHLKPY